MELHDDLKEYTITIKREVLMTVHVSALSKEDARNAFYSGNYSEGQEIDMLNEDIVSVRED